MLPATVGGLCRSKSNKVVYSPSPLLSSLWTHKRKSPAHPHTLQGLCTVERSKHVLTFANIATDLAEEMLAGKGDLRNVLLKGFQRVGVHFDLARSVDRYANASHGFGLYALNREGDQFQTQVFHIL